MRQTAQTSSQGLDQQHIAPVEHSIDQFQQPPEPSIKATTPPLTNKPVKNPVVAKTVCYLPAPNLANAKKYRRTSLEARAYAFIRKKLLRQEDVDLDRLRAYDEPYINKKLEDYKHSEA
ncbi:hypothetical protein QFC22_006465 [Naganishia vaughanmartiniae]|uniref:Uncharacterized protein n=1 Tax=Naganishia vaughanmartiniae TaxID=1424756 RepID=A0ACC2WIT1_9TREE|nr:hypothetical protein QFC22_006465 [Naganishia vaughanmartiniae]